MSSSNSVTVQILDKEYSIICPPEERNNLVSAARYLDGKMREIRSSGKVIGADRIAVMAALNITHEMLHRQEDRSDTPVSGTSREQVRDLLERVDQALSDDAGTKTAEIGILAPLLGMRQSVMSLSRYAQPRGLHAGAGVHVRPTESLNAPAISTLNFRVQGLHR